MDSEEKKLLQETFELVKDNNEMLRNMRSSMRWARFMSILYWIFIIGSAIGIYYYIEPYIDQLIKVYENASEVLKKFP